MSRSERAWFGGLFVLTIAACSVDTHQRCDETPTACPTGFYCDGEWCFPDGIGPGDPDGTVGVDAADLGPASDMRPDATLDQMVSDIIGTVDPADRVVSGAVSGRDTIRVEITDAAIAETALVAPGAACVGWLAMDVVDGKVTLEASAWQAFGTSGRFDLCVRAGGDMLRFSMFEIDEVAPSLIDFSSGTGVSLQASEPLSAASIGQAGCGVAMPLDINEDPTRASTGNTPLGVLGIQLTDAIGNRSACLELTRVTHECALDSTLIPGIAPRALGDDFVSSCEQVIIEGGELDGLCSTCTLLERTDDSYVAIAIEARRPRLAVPTVYATEPGVGRVSDAMLDVALVDRDRLLMTDNTRIEFWARAGGIFRPGLFGLAMRGSGITPVRVPNGQTQVAIANPNDVPGFVIVNEALEATQTYRDSAGLRLSDLISLSDDMRDGDLAGLREGGIASVFKRTANWAAFDLRDGVTHLARLNQRGVVMTTLDNEVFLYEEAEVSEFNEVAMAPVAGPHGCLATGDWTGDGEADVIVCAGSSLVVLPVRPGAIRRFEEAITIPVGALAIESLVIGDADGDGRPDALVVDGGGQVRLVINAPGNPIHLLDAPYPVRALRALGDADAPLDVALLPSAGRSFSRWTSPIDPVDPIAHAIRLAADAEVVGVGDLDCDQRANVVVRDRVSKVFEVLPTLGVQALVLFPPAAKPADAVGLGDLNGDGWPDVAAWEDNELQSWRAQPSDRLTRDVQDMPADDVSALALGDWSGLGKADLVLRTGDDLTHYHRGPGVPLMLSRRATKTISGLLGFAIANLNATPALELFVGRRTTQNALSLLDFMRFGGATGGASMLGLTRTVVAPVAGTPRLFTLQVSEARDADVVKIGETVIMTGHLLDLAVGDFDMDGQHEVVVLVEDDAQERSLHFLMPDDDGGYTAMGEPERVAADTVAIRAGDLDGNGRLDVIRFTQ